MIKNWKLFLENSEDDDSELIRNGEELKASLKGFFAKFFLVEFFLRITGNKENIKQGVEVISETMIKMFGECLAQKDFPEEFVEILTNAFAKSTESAREIMINDSFEKGLDVMVDNWIQTMIDIKKSWQREGEGWKEEKDRDYSDLSKSELNELIDKALDDRDFAQVKFLSQYLKESANYNPQKEIEDLSYKIAELFIQFVINNNLVK